MIIIFYLVLHIQRCIYTVRLRNVIIARQTYYTTWFSSHNTNLPITTWASRVGVVSGRYKMVYAFLCQSVASTPCRLLYSAVYGDDMQNAVSEVSHVITV